MESLTLEQVSYLAEIIGVIVVVISLIYVGAQIKQNTNATQAAAAQSFVEMYNTFTSAVGSSEEMADIWRIGLTDMDILGETEKVRFSAIAAQCMKVFESGYLQWQRGALDDDLWSGLSVAAIDVVNQPGVRKWWSFRKKWHGKAFQNWIDTHHLSTSSQSMYPFLTQTASSDG